MVKEQIMMQQVVYIHKETTNQSFIDMHYYLKQTGRTNNDFFLVLYDEGLSGVDPRDPNLSPMMKQRVLRECCANYWYFLREVVRIPVQGGAVGNGFRYKLHRGNLAMNFLFILNYNMFVELPRQHFKTTSALVRYLWCYNFGTSNSEIMFVHKDHSGSKGNLRDLKEIRDALPSYLQMSSAVAIDGHKLKVPNTVVAMQHPINNNKITTFPSARSQDAADKLGRGMHMPIQYYDEFAFMLYNQYAYTAAAPAYSRAAMNAKENNAPYGILITTTPGDLTNDHGMYAYTLRNASTVWNEAYYDYTYEQLEELRKSNTSSPFFLISYTYQQLGSGEEYFQEMVVQLAKDWAKIRREVLLEWSKTSSTCPFSHDDLDRIKQFCREPIRTILFGRVGQYQFNVYQDIDLRYPPIVGVDVAGAMYQDSSAITVIDSRTTMVTATLNCNFIPTDDLAEVLYTLVTKYMSNAIINIERNGGFGLSVIQRLVKTSIKKNLYYEIKEKVYEQRYENGMKMPPLKQKVREFGTNSNKEVRSRLIEILYDRVDHHKDKFIAPILHDELETMETKKNGKVEHSDGAHDDQIFSYLMALYVWYDGVNLVENFGIRKNTIKTDDDEEVLDMDLEGAEYEPIEIDNSIVEDIDDDIAIKETLEYIDDASRYVSYTDFVKNQYIESRNVLNYILTTNKDIKTAYENKYHIDHVENSLDGMNFVRLPDSMFSMNTEEDELQQEYIRRNGNLFDLYNRI